MKLQYLETNKAPKKLKRLETVAKCQTSWNSSHVEVLCAPVVGVPLRREGDAHRTDAAGRRRRLEEAPCVGQRAGAPRTKEDQRRQWRLRLRRSLGRRIERIGLQRSLDGLVLVCSAGSLEHWIHASRGKIWSDFLLPIFSGTVLPTLMGVVSWWRRPAAGKFCFLAFVIDLDKTWALGHPSCYRKKIWATWALFFYMKPEPLIWPEAHFYGPVQGQLGTGWWAWASTT